MHHFRRQRLWGRIWSKIAKIFRILKNILLILLALGFGIYLGTAAWLYWEFSRAPKVKQESVLVMDIEGMIQDRPSMDPVTERLSGELGKTRHIMVNNIRKAAKDPRILGILLDIGYYSMDSTTRYEIREELLKFKDSGKKVFAFTESTGLFNYLLMSVADKIYMPPSGHTFFPGLRFEIPFFKDMFELIGITPEFVAVGKYKTAPQIFTMNQLSDAYREVLNNLLDNYYQNYVEKIAAARNVPEERAMQWIEAGIYSADDALEAGVLDRLVYENNLEEIIQQELGLIEEAQTGDQEKKNEEGDDEEKPELNKIYNGQYARVDVNVPNLYQEGEKIAVIYAQGSIVSGQTEPPNSDNPTIGSESMTELLGALAADEDIKGILLRIDSGGGGARASDIIRNAVAEANAKKPVVVSMAGAAASGGYMISAPAASIVAYPMTITGSIGIFGGKFSMAGLFDLIRLRIESLQRGKHAGIFSSARTWNDDEARLFREFIEQGYQKFLTHVAEGRDMTVEAVHEVAQGRVWLGKEAIDLGLVDQLGGFDTAVGVLKEHLEIPEDEDVKLVEYPKLESPFEQMLKRIRQVPMDTDMPEELLKLDAFLSTLAKLQDESLFAWFPYQLVEQEE